MKKLLTAIAAAVFLIYPSLCFSSYIIHLKDGRAFATDRYYEEGDQIKFKRYGGVIGIQKDLIKEIEVTKEVEALPTEKEKAKSTKEDVSQSAKKQGAEKEGGAEAEGKVKEGKKEVPEKVAVEQGEPEKGLDEEKKKAEQEKAAKIEAFLEEKREIMEERKVASEAFKEAKAKNDKAAAKKHFQRIVSLQEKIKKLEKRVKAAFGGKLPDWWQE